MYYVIRWGGFCVNESGYIQVSKISMNFCFESFTLYFVQIVLKLNQYKLIFKYCHCKMGMLCLLKCKTHTESNKKANYNNEVEEGLNR